MSLRGLLVITGIVAGLFVVACSVGYEEALGILLTLVLFTWAVRCRRRGMFLPLRYLAVALGIGTLWMVAVDRSAIYEKCPDCNLDRNICQWRLFRIPLYESIIREHNTSTSRIAADLGEPCAHQFGRAYLSRYWGLFFPAHPNFSGIICLVEDEWYDENVSEIVRAKGRASPGLAQEFHQKAIVEHDHAYRQQFCEELIRLKEHSTTQPKSQIVPDRER